MSSLIDIIIPTYNNTRYLRQCLISLFQARPVSGPIRVLVVNNGEPNSCDWIKDHPWPSVEVISADGQNLGWEGGLELGLSRSTSPYVLFCNDDVVFPYATDHWLDVLVNYFAYSWVGAVGPASNNVMGMQSLFVYNYPAVITTKFLIGFCLLVRRSALDAVGGIDRTLPGGDDLDLSFRLRAAGLSLIADRRVFVFHFGFKTGERVHGTASDVGGWNSEEMRAATNEALIAKHGQSFWDDAMTGAWQVVTPPPMYALSSSTRGTFNPLDYSICLTQPRRTTASAWLEHIPFAYFLVAALRPLMIVELGTHYGASYCAFCQAVEMTGIAARCYAIDTWSGDGQTGSYGPEVLADLRAHHDPQYASFSRLIQSDFDTARDEFADGEIDVLHLDGDHRYEAVRHDFESWRSKMSDRGVIVFHDIAVHYPGFGVWEFWAELTQVYRHFEFQHGHGLGLIFLGEEPTPFEQMLRGAADGGDAIRAHFSSLGARVQREADLQQLRQQNEAQLEEIAKLRADIPSGRAFGFTPVQTGN